MASEINETNTVPLSQINMTAVDNVDSSAHLESNQTCLNAPKLVEQSLSTWTHVKRARNRPKIEMVSRMFDVSQLENTWVEMQRKHETFI